jgi:hypothetical protein
MKKTLGVLAAITVMMLGTFVLIAQQVVALQRR